MYNPLAPEASNMYPSRVLAVLVCLVAGASLLSGGSPAAASEPRWSRNIIQNGDFSNGLDGWELSRFGAKITMDSGNPAASWTIPRTRACSVDTLPITTRFPIDSQRVGHTFRISLRYKVDSSARGQVGVVASIKDAAGLAPATLGNNLLPLTVIEKTATSETATQPYPVRPIRNGVWEAASFDFPATSAGLEDGLALSLTPTYIAGEHPWKLGGQQCDPLPEPTLQVTLDDVRLQFLAPRDRPAIATKAFPTSNSTIADEHERAADLLNQYRLKSGAPVASLIPDPSDGTTLHAKYITLNKIGGHFEVSGAPGFTAAGDEAARRSNLCSRGGTVPNTWADTCMSNLLLVPFHRTGLIQPDYTAIQIGTAATPTYAGMVVRMGSASAAPPAGSAVIWPADGVTGVPAGTAINETPNPLPMCGLSQLAVVGYPITVQFGSRFGATVANLETTLSDLDGQEVEACTLDLSTPFAAPPGLYSVGGGESTAFRGRVFVIPLHPLERTTAYTFTISATVDGRPGTWTSRFVTEGSFTPLIASAVPKPVLAEKWASALPASGVALASFRGGTVADAASGMRQLHALSGGRFVSYVVGAPDFVNDAFLRLFPGEQIPAGAILSVTIDSE